MVSLLSVCSTYQPLHSTTCSPLFLIFGFFFFSWVSPVEKCLYIFSPTVCIHYFLKGTLSWWTTLFHEGFSKNCSLNIPLEATKIRGNNVTGYLYPFNSYIGKFGTMLGTCLQVSFPKIVLCFVTCSRLETLQVHRLHFGSFSIPIHAGEPQQMLFFCLFCFLFKISVSVYDKKIEV